MLTGKTILFVEDDLDLLDFSGKVLKKLGYHVFTAENAEAALQVLTNPTISLDLLISDIRLPGDIDGVELAKQALKLRTNLKILLASGYASYFVEQTIGNFPFIEKPYYPQKLNQTIQALIGAA